MMTIFRTVLEFCRTTMPMASVRIKFFAAREEETSQLSGRHHQLCCTEVGSWAVMSLIESQQVLLLPICYSDTSKRVDQVKVVCHYLAAISHHNLCVIIERLSECKSC